MFFLSGKLSSRMLAFNDRRVFGFPGVAAAVLDSTGSSCATGIEAIPLAHSLGRSLKIASTCLGPEMPMTACSNSTHERIPFDPHTSLLYRQILPSLSAKCHAFTGQNVPSSNLEAESIPTLKGASTTGLTIFLESATSDLADRDYFHSVDQTSSQSHHSAAKADRRWQGRAFYDYDLHHLDSSFKLITAWAHQSSKTHHCTFDPGTIRDSADAPYDCSEDPSVLGAPSLLVHIQSPGSAAKEIIPPFVKKMPLRANETTRRGRERFRTPSPPCVRLSSPSSLRSSSPDFWPYVWTAPLPSSPSSSTCQSPSSSSGLPDSGVGASETPAPPSSEFAAPEDATHSFSAPSASGLNAHPSSTSMSNSSCSADSTTTRTALSPVVPKAPRKQKPFGRLDFRPDLDFDANIQARAFKAKVWNTCLEELNILYLHVVNWQDPRDHFDAFHLDILSRVFMDIDPVSDPKGSARALYMWLSSMSAFKARKIASGNDPSNVWLTRNYPLPYYQQSGPFHHTPAANAFTSGKPEIFNPDLNANATSVDGAVFTVTRFPANPNLLTRTQTRRNRIIPLMARLPPEIRVMILRDHLDLYSLLRFGQASTLTRRLFNEVPHLYLLQTLLRPCIISLIRKAKWGFTDDLDAFDMGWYPDNVVDPIFDMPSHAVLSGLANDKCFECLAPTNVLVLDFKKNVAKRWCEDCFRNMSVFSVNEVNWVARTMRELIWEVDYVWTDIETGQQRMDKKKHKIYAACSPLYYGFVTFLPFLGFFPKADDFAGFQLT
ncbi:uncharacterized protein BCR38DRAFT_415110 [Pseudomassariella vexata]|uniref:F-box domain-containing protein n=1 Tax=Pseudomassariella vexata TaxID=1141098 RepID=A0A1Y2D6Y5_9PEZI|nr:uncharacterized protein BCR38DRAFT_415110 [Pseudomassariella vexata]ORY54957.1 hypothetical protein BCR38DRAFT_415110 [Pseudomassariella vexata]